MNTLGRISLMIIMILGCSESQGQQQIVVTYDTLVFDDNTTETALIYESGTLTTSPTSSIYETTGKDTVFDHPSLGTFDLPKGAIPKRYYKNRKEKSILYPAPYLRDKVVRDYNYQIDWKMTGQKKKILGYECEEASANWRGRSYLAYFTPDIPINDGPFKFDGLPGLILEIVSTDGIVKIHAKGIKNSENEISDPYTNTTSLDWEEYLKFYKKKYDQISNFTTEQNTSVSIPKRYIETYVQ